MEEEEEDNRLEGGGGKNWIPLSCIEGGSGSVKLEEEDTEEMIDGGGTSCAGTRGGFR